MLTRREECNIYLRSLRLQLIKATMLAESSVLYFFFLSGSLHYSYVYNRELGRCHTLPFFLTFFIIKTRYFPGRQIPPGGGGHPASAGFLDSTAIQRRETWKVHKEKQVLEGEISRN